MSKLGSAGPLKLQRFKAFYAELTLENAAINDAFSRRLSRGPREIAVAVILVEEHHRSVHSACQIAQLSRIAYYRPQCGRSTRMRLHRAALTALLAQWHRWGF
jgi:hypothetical protein